MGVSRIFGEDTGDIKNIRHSRKGFIPEGEFVNMIQNIKNKESIFRKAHFPCQEIKTNQEKHTKNRKNLESFQDVTKISF